MSRRAAGLVGGLALAAVVCAASGFALAAPAATTRPPLSVSVDGERFTAHPTRSLRADELAPGRSASTVIGLRSGVDGAAAVSLQLFGTGGRPGALWSAIRITVNASDADGREGQPLWTGPITALGTPTKVGVVLPPGGDDWVRITAEVPATAGNEVAGQVVDFGMRAALVDAGLDVAGVSTSRHGGGRDDGDLGPDVASGTSLGYTGTPLALLSAAAALLLAAGGVVLIGGSRRVRRGRAPARAR